jgi:hypothetical protein
MIPDGWTTVLLRDWLLSESVGEVPGELGKGAWRLAGDRLNVSGDEVLVSGRQHAVEVGHVLSEPGLHAEAGQRVPHIVR